MLCVLIRLLVRNHLIKLSLVLFLQSVLLFILFQQQIFLGLFEDYIPAVAAFFPSEFYQSWILPWSFQIAVAFIVWAADEVDGIRVFVYSLVLLICFSIFQGVHFFDSIVLNKVSTVGVIKSALVIEISALSILMIVFVDFCGKSRNFGLFSSVVLLFVFYFQVRYFCVTGIWMSLGLVYNLIFGSIMSDAGVSIRAVWNSFLCDILPGLVLSAFILWKTQVTNRTRLLLMSAWLLFISGFMVVFLNSPRDGLWIESRIMAWPRIIATLLKPKQLIPDMNDVSWKNYALNRKSLETQRSIFIISIEGLRFDALPHMPFLDSLAASNVRFAHHYSSGNGTPLGLFGLIFGEQPLYYLYQGYGKKSIFETLFPKHSFVTANSGTWGYCRMDSVIFKRFLDVSKPHRDLKTIDGLFSHIDSVRGPFFAVLMLDGTHHPYNPNVGSVRDSNDIIPFNQNRSFSWSDAKIQDEKVNYWGAVRIADECLREIFVDLRKRNLQDSTIVFITGDHGEEFFEAGYFAHSTDANRYQLQVPGVLISAKAKHVSVNAYTSHTDVWRFIEAEALGNFNDTVNALDRNRKVVAWSFPMRSFDYPLEYGVIFSPNGDVRFLKTARGMIKDPWSSK